MQDVLYYKILDGQDRIGANLIELCCNGTQILVECGVELEPTKEGERLRGELVKRRYDACVITHYHADHAGLLTVPVNCDEIFIGEKALKVLKAVGGVCEENLKKIRTLKHNYFYLVGDISFIPYLCDHSAYDSYMVVFHSKKNGVLYTGDFRAHGRKNFDALLAALPKRIDTIICEGTNLGNTSPTLSERQLEEELTGLFAGDKAVFILQSATNIDRTVSVYRAAIRSGRSLVMRLSQAKICELLENIPNPCGFKRCFVRAGYAMDEKEFAGLKQKYGRRLIGVGGLSKLKRFVLEVSCRDAGYLRALSQAVNLKGAVLVYSMWRGYMRDSETADFLKAAEELGIERVYLHSSGHADRVSIEKLLKTVNHTQVKFIHNSL